MADENSQVEAETTEATAEVTETVTESANDNTPAANDNAPEDTATLAEGGGQADEEVERQIVSQFPDNWRDIFAGGDKRHLATLNRFASPVNLFKSYMAMRQRVDSGELQRNKPDGDNEQELNAWRAQVGIPEKPEGYLDKLPDGLVVGDEDKEMVETFLADMHTADAPPALVHRALGWYYGHQEKLLADRAENDKKFRANAEDELRGEWGPDYRSNLNDIANLVRTYGDEDVLAKLFASRTNDGYPLGNDPDVLRFLASVSREINPAGTIVPNEGQTPMQTLMSRKAEIEAKMANTRDRGPDSYLGNEAMQAEYRQIIEQLERLERRNAA